jgi:hypothetical protein
LPAQGFVPILLNSEQSFPEKCDLIVRSCLLNWVSGLRRAVARPQSTATSKGDGMRESYFHGRTLVYSIVAALCFMACETTPALVAQDRDAEAHRYSVASIRGDYAVVNHYGADLALGVGTIQFDGAGNLHGTLLLNRPTSTGARELVALTSTGTYSVSDDGMGIILLSVILPDGTIRNATEDFVITRAEVIHGILVAMKIVDEQREPSLVLGNGVFVTQDITRRMGARKE